MARTLKEYLMQEKNMGSSAAGAQCGHAFLSLGTKKSGTYVIGGTPINIKLDHNWTLLVEESEEE